VSAPVFRIAGEKDLSVIAEIHKQAYSRSHFTTLLPAAVLEDYYRLFLGGGAEILLCETQYGDVLGFAVYGFRIAERIAVFKHEARRRIAWTAAKYPIRSFRKAASNFLGRLRTSEAGQEVSPFLLLSIAVSTKGRGVGGELLREMLVRAEDQGVDRVGLYVNVDNLTAINRYFLSGFSIKAMSVNQYYMEYRI